MYIAHAYTYIVVDPLPCSEISRELDELAEICSNISRVAGFQGAARFRGNTVLTYPQCGVVKLFQIFYPWT